MIIENDTVIVSTVDQIQETIVWKNNWKSSDSVISVKDSIILRKDSIIMHKDSLIKEKSIQKDVSENKLSECEKMNAVINDQNKKFRRQRNIAIGFIGLLTLIIVI